MKNWQNYKKKYFEKSEYKNHIQSFLGNALEIIPTIKQKFDLVFIDADKLNYSNYFYLVIDKMNKGGIILSDNVLWSGKVVEKLDPKDKDTKALLAYNLLLNTDERVETVLLPIRDGLTISRVK
jgi:predicted O-methyltransferase YrrM